MDGLSGEGRGRARGVDAPRAQAAIAALLQDYAKIVQNSKPEVSDVCAGWRWSVSQAHRCVLNALVYHNISYGYSNTTFSLFLLLKRKKRQFNTFSHGNYAAGSSQVSAA